MSSERLKTQMLFQDILGDNDYQKFKKKKAPEIKNFSISRSHTILFQSTLRDDASDFYYKGIVSLSESLIATNFKRFSWATVKLYYSIFYFLRASLCLSDIGYVRKERDGYYFFNNAGNNFISIPSSDHVAAIELSIKYNSNTDIIQSNSIADHNPYKWLMKQRECVNYTNRTFYEPEFSDTWISISNAIDSDNLTYWITKYLNENLYSFLEDHAVLAMPLQVLSGTYKRFTLNDISPIKSEKMAHIQNLMQQNIFLSFLYDFILLKDE
jgi:hypothetical protein